MNFTTSMTDANYVTIALLMTTWNQHGYANGVMAVEISSTDFSTASAVRVWSKGPGGPSNTMHMMNHIRYFSEVRLMSTLKTANIQDTSGNNNSTPEEINQGRAKAWVNF